MLVLWTCMLLASAAAHRVVESTEDITPEGTNTTTLFPVQPINRTSTSKQKTATSWKIETTFGESKLDSNSTDSKEQLVLERPSNGSQEFKASPHEGNYVEDEGFDFVPTKATPGAFEGVLKKPPAGFISQEFKASPHDGNYVEDERFDFVPTKATPGAFEGVLKKPPAGFISFPKEHKTSNEVFKNFQKFPYSIAPPIMTKAKDEWRPVSSLDSKPTDESPVRVPAGGLYKHPDPFKVKPGTTEEDFGLEFSHDGKEHPVRKRMNPMKNLLHLLTALIPVGIIFSALTPTLITIEPDQSVPPNVFRRADGSFTSVPQISERCRRRLLCELQSETNYRQSGASKPRQCNRIRCEDPETLAQTLQWLLSYSPTGGHGLRPTTGSLRPTDGQSQRPSNYRPTNGHVDNHQIHKPDRYRPGNYAHVKHGPDDGYGSKYLSKRPGDTGDQFNADFT